MSDPRLDYLADCMAEERAKRRIAADHALYFPDHGRYSYGRKFKPTGHKGVGLDAVMAHLKKEGIV